MKIILFKLLDEVTELLTYDRLSSVNEAFKNSIE